MNLPNIWGQGALFAFSALDGTCTPKMSLVGNLMGDKLGVEFRHPEKFSFYFTFSNLLSIDFDVVASDIIKANILEDDTTTSNLDIIFVTQSAILMRYPKTASFHIMFEADVKEYKSGYLKVYTVGKENITILSRDGEDYTYTVLSCGKHSEKEANSLIELDINREISKKLSFFEKLPIVSLDDPDTERLLYKCFSVMKASYMSGGGLYTGIWSSVSRTDSEDSDYADWALSLLAGKYFGNNIAEESLNTIVDLGEPSGRILKNDTYGRTKSALHYPVIAWMALEVYKITENRDFLYDIYEKLKKYMQWIMENKDFNKEFLYSWNADSNGNFININECDMKGSPRLEDNSPIEALDFTSFMAKEALSMAEIAKILERQGESLYWDVVYDRIRKNLNTKLFDEEDKCFYDRFTSGGAFKKVKTIASFMPGFAGVCDSKTLSSLTTALFDEEGEYVCESGIPSMPVSDEKFENDMWYGAMHPIYNYFALLGMNHTGHKKQCEAIREKILSAVLKWYKNDGVIYECYDAFDYLSPSRMSKNRYNLIPESFDSELKVRRDDFHTACAVIALIMWEIK
ncbi:MAG: hypothetical protein E7396_04125 [Ruminococcaceae bacterium]|nr:hypothetical protein [Oscillospiraceae bacterium]